MRCELISYAVDLIKWTFYVDRKIVGGVGDEGNGKEV